MTGQPARRGPVRARRARRGGFLGIALAGAVALAAVGAEGAERLRLPGIKGADDREIVDTDVYPWSAIGRVNRRTGGFCTGSLIGPRLVLTAAHCLWNGRTRRLLNPVSLHFVVGYRRGGYLADSPIASYQVAPGYVSGGGPTTRNQAHDWALLTLANDLEGVAGALPVAAFDPAALRGYRGEGRVFLQAGYSQDKAHILSLHYGCEVTGFLGAGALVVHDCDATMGDSGSPVLVQIGDAFGLVAMHVATVRTKGRTFGIAVPASAFGAAALREPSRAGAP